MPIYQHSPFDSNKINGLAFRYEIELSISTKRIVRVNERFLIENWPDLNMFKLKTRHYLRNNETVVAGNGYGPSRCVTFYFRLRG